MSTFYAQSSLTEKFSMGVQAEYVNQGGKLGEYWGNTFSGGIFIDYKLTENFSYELSFNLSKVSEGKFNNTVLPDITIFNIPVGGVIKFALSENMELNSFIGIENIMMIFDESDLQDTNLNESEFGVVVSLGVNYKPFDLELFTKFRNMFSEPENTPFFSVGFKKRLF